MNETEQRVLKLFDELERKTIDLHTFFELVGGTSAAQQTVLSVIESLLARGWLEERGGDFYSRTEAGRLALQK